MHCSKEPLYRDKTTAKGPSDHPKEASIERCSQGDEREAESEAMPGFGGLRLKSHVTSVSVACLLKNDSQRS